MRNGGLQGYEEMSAIENVCLERFCGSVIGGHLFTTASENISLSGGKPYCVSEVLGLISSSWPQFTSFLMSSTIPALRNSYSYGCPPPLQLYIIPTAMIVLHHSSST